VALESQLLALLAIKARKDSERQDMGRPKSPALKRTAIDGHLRAAGLQPLQSRGGWVPCAPDSDEVKADLAMLSGVSAALEIKIRRWEKKETELGDEASDDFKLEGKELSAARLEAFQLIMDVVGNAMSWVGNDMRGFRIIEAAIESAATGTGQDYKKLRPPRPSSSKRSPKMQRYRSMVFAYAQLHPSEVDELCKSVASIHGISVERVETAVNNFESNVKLDPYLLREVEDSIAFLRNAPWHESGMMPLEEFLSYYTHLVEVDRLPDPDSSALGEEDNLP